MPKVTTLQFAETASQVRTWPAKTRAKLVELILGWNTEGRTEPKSQKPKMERGKPDSDGGL